MTSSTIQPFGYNRHGPKTGGCAPFMGGGSCDPIQHNVAWAEVYLHTKWHLDPSSRLATIDLGQKLGGWCALFFFGGEAGSPSITKSPGPRPTSIPSGILVHPAVWPQQTLAKNWGGCTSFRGTAGSTSNTMSPMMTPTSSEILTVLGPEFLIGRELTRVL